MSNVLDDRSVLTCAHQGKVQLKPSGRKVTIEGSAVLTGADVLAVSACTLPPAAGGPCKTASFATAATRVTVSGQPVLVSSGVATCSPTTTPVSVVRTQSRVKAT